MSNKIRVLVVDDSALMRQLMIKILERESEFEVVAVAQDPYDAWHKVREYAPDVMTLDVEMPKMDGLSFLERLMHLHPMPVLMVSSLTERSCAATLRALELGAIDFVSKPKLDLEEGIALIGTEIMEKLRVVAKSIVKKSRHLPDNHQRTHRLASVLNMTLKVVVVGASTGGTEALREVICALPPDAPPLAVVQHMPPGFTKSFAERLNSLAAVRVKEAVEGDRLVAGQVLVAPGDQHMELRRSGAAFSVHLHQHAPVNRHRPSVDVLFDSCAEHAEHNSVGVILTGMGNDGARGLRRMHDCHARTIAQDEASCVVYGMPKEAVSLGAVDHILPLQCIAEGILAACQMNT